MNKSSIDSVIDRIEPYFEDIILDEYGNYMFQSLISVCDLSQRFRILMKIKETIPILACQQQGTFVFQQYVNFLKDEE